MFVWIWRVAPANYTSNTCDCHNSHGTARPQTHHPYLTLLSLPPFLPPPPPRYQVHSIICTIRSNYFWEDSKLNTPALFFFFPR